MTAGDRRNIHSSRRAQQVRRTYLARAVAQIVVVIAHHRLAKFNSLGATASHFHRGPVAYQPLYYSTRSSTRYNEVRGPLWKRTYAISLRNGLTRNLRDL